MSWIEDSSGSTRSEIKRRPILFVVGLGLVVAPVLQVGCLAAEGHQAFEDPPPEHILRFRVGMAWVPSAAHDLLAGVC